MSSQSPPSSHYHDAPEVHRQVPVKADDNKVCSLLAFHVVKARSNILKTSKNPFRQALPTSASVASSGSHESQSSVPGRQKPPRTVFKDLPTAHSSITSGTARNQQRAAPNSVPVAWEEENSIPLQEFDVPERKNHPSPSLLDDLPLPPPPAAIVQRRFNKQSSDSDSCLVADDDKFASEQTKQNFKKGKQHQNSLKASSVYHTSLGALPSSLPRNKASLNNGTRSRKHNFESYTAALAFPDLVSTPAPNEPTPLLPRQSAKTSRALTNAASSLPEGSTVGNIYKHYVRSEIFDDGESDWDDVQSAYDLADGYPPAQRFGSHTVDNGLSSGSLSSSQQSALEIRKQRRAERMKSGVQPPASALPSLPIHSSHLLPSSSRGVEPSSSYGDTYNLLDLTEQSPWTPNLPVLRNDRSDVRADQALSGSDNSSLRASYPFRSNNGPQIHVSQAEDENDDDYRSYLNNHNQDRQPLAWEVSQALRRASNLSAYSDGSIATSIVENYRHLQSKASNSNELGMLRRQLGNSHPSEPEIDEEPRAAAAWAFYDQEAIPSNWIADRQQNLIRIPIQQHIHFPNSPPIPEDEVNSKRDEDEANDWETVGESGFDTEYKGSTPAMLGAHRTGSSIADTSDAGTASTHIPEITDYGSTERIAQHPGHIEYHGDYRQRDLKKTKIPVILPVYGEHKVNGWMADSNRLRSPRNGFYHTPEPLQRRHTNPFNSPPPEIAPTYSANKPYTSLNRRQRPPKPNYFPSPVSIKTNSSSDDTGVDQRRVARGRPTRSGAVQNFSRPSNWMDDFTEPGPEVKSNGAFLDDIPHVAGSADRPSSWHLATAFANGETIPGYNLDGVRIVADAEQGRTNNDGFLEQKTYGGKHGPTGNKERNTLVKGPPGAFYGNLLRPKAERSQSHKIEGTRKLTNPYRQSSANGPTNSLRPLALAGRQDRPLTPTNNIDVGLDMYPNASLSREPNDFIYRSPLAPPKRKTWQEMYTQEQMSEFRATNVDGAFEPRTAEPNAGLLGGGDCAIPQGASSVHLYEEPRMWGGQQRKGFGFGSWEEPRARDRFDPDSKHKQYSILALCLCNIIFPMLILFAWGKLDWIMYWCSTGQYHSFGKHQKKAAQFCLAGWVLGSAIVLTVILVWYFSTHSHPLHP